MEEETREESDELMGVPAPRPELARITLEAERGGAIHTAPPLPTRLCSPPPPPRPAQTCTKHTRCHCNLLL